MEQICRHAKYNRTAKLGRPAEARSLFFVLLLTLTLAACAPDPDISFQQAKSQFEHGNLADAAAASEAGYKRFQNKPQSPWYWKYKLQWAGMLLDNGRTKEAEALLTAEPPAEFSDQLPRYRMHKAYVLYRKQQIPAGRSLLASAKAGAQAVKDRESEADICLLSGVCALHYEDDNARAQAEFQSALTLADAQKLDYQRIAALINLGALELRKQHYADAFPFLDRAVAIARKGGYDFLASRALGNIANCYQNLGQLDQALKVREQAVSIQADPKSRLAPALSDSYSALGGIYLEKGDTAKAAEYFRRALAMVSKDSPVQYWRAAGSLASALERSGSLDEAEHFNQAGLQVVSQKDTDGIASLTLNEAEIAEHRQRHAEAKTAYEKVVAVSAKTPSALWQAYAGLASIDAAAGDFNSANHHYEQALQVVDASRADQLYSRYKINFLNNLIQLYEAYVTFLMQHDKPRQALEIADSSRASVLTEGLLGKTDTRKKELASEVQRAAKASHSIFLFYWLAPKKSYLWALTEKDSQVIELPGKPQIDRDVQSYQALIEQHGDPLTTPSPAGQRLYSTLIQPVERLIPTSGRVVIVPDGSLHNLNFETLVSSNPKPHYWLEDVTISVTPSLGVLRAAKPAAALQPALLLMGDPVTQGTGFDELPQAKQEMAGVKQHFPEARNVAVYAREKATPEAYSAAHPHQFSTIHFATHVEPNEQSPLDSAIILSTRTKGNGFRLYARDVAEMPLSADLVTISACRGAGTRALSGEGLVGFAWAFFHAGARNVVTSLWDANDESTTELMGRFYEGLEKRHAYASALRDAKISMLQSKYRKPYYWAPFQLYSLSIESSTLR